ncbi:MAG: hypothetical protein IH991_05045 [Planctomycetes bacterium]|nr:hypothetical protein [Planctomycetota bacterium]
MEPFPQKSFSGNEYSTLRAAWHYVPGEHQRVRLEPNPDSTQHLAWVWNCSVVSQWSQNGAIHRITYFVENTGSRQLMVKLPSALTLRQLRVNDQEIDRVNSETELIVPLPVGQRYPKIEITVEDRQPLPRFWQELNLPLPTVNVPVLGQKWTVWLPNGYRPRPEDLAGLQTSLSPAKRLLGPLCVGNLGPFRLEDSEHWRGLARFFTNKSDMERHARTVVNSFVDSFNDLKEHATGDRITWGQMLLHQLELSADSVSRPKLLMDASALKQNGITPEATLVELNPGDEPWELLARSNLVLLVHENAVVLTSSHIRGLLATQLESTHRKEIAIVANDSADALSILEGVINRSRSVTAWCEQSMATQTAWNRTPVLDFASMSDVGWRAFPVKLSGNSGSKLSGNSGSLRVYRTATLRAFAWGAFFLTTAGAWWLGNKRPIALILAIAFSGLVTLLVPSWLVPISSAMFLGVAFGSVLVLFWKHVPFIQRRPAAMARRQRVASTASLCIAVIFCVATSFADDTEPTKSPPNKVQPQPYHPVLIGMDDQQQPAGKLVYMPTKFNDEILNREANLGRIAKDWIATSAEYECVMREEVGRPLTAHELVARFELNATRPCRVSLPVSRENLVLLPKRGKLDSQPIPLDWSTDESHLEFDIAQPGLHRLEVAFRPVTKAAGDWLEFEARIPRLLNSRLKIQGPHGGRVMTPSALGARRLDAETGVLSVDLGPTDRLALRWPLKAGINARENRISVSQLTWMRVDPGSVVLDTKFTFQIPKGREFRSVEILVDPRLQMRIPGDQPARIKTQTDTSDGFHKISLEIDPLENDSLTIEAAFSLYSDSEMEVSGVGSFHLPRIEAIAETTTRRWFAVSVDAKNLNFSHAPVELMEVDDFVQRWGKPAQGQKRPQLAFTLPDGYVSWTLATRSLDTQVTTDSKTVIQASIHDLDVHFQATTQITGELYQMRLQIPPAMQVRQVSLREDDNERVQRWSLSDAKTIHVTFNGAVSGTQQLVVFGTQKVPNSLRLRLPQISLLNSRSLKRKFEIFRRSTVGKIVLLKRGGLRDVEMPKSDENPHRQGPLVLEEIDPTVNSSSNATLQLIRNTPKASCNAVTTVLRSEGTWYAELVCEVNRKAGAIDEIQFSIPANWQDLVGADDAMILRQIKIPGQDRKLLVIEPRDPTSDTIRIRVRGKLSGQLAMFPDIFPAAAQHSPFGTDGIALYVMLPTQMDDQQIDWDTLGLEESPVPDQLAALVKQGAHATFRAVEFPYQAKVREVRASPQAPRVRLADHHIAWSEDGSCFGIAFFGLEPNGHNSCELSLPKGLQLVQVTVEGRTAMLSKKGASSWNIGLGPVQLPQQIAVVFQGRVFTDDEKQTFTAPRIAGADRTKTLWTIHHPRWSSPASDDSATRVVQHEQYDLRIQSILELLNSASDAAIKESQQEINDWFESWSQRFTYALEHFEELKDANSESRVEQYKRQIESTANELNTGNLVGLRGDLVNPVVAWSVEPSSMHSSTYHITSGSSSTIDVNAQSSGADSIIGRIGPAAFFLGIVAALYVLITRGPLVEWCIRWPYAFAALFGLVWWMWLTPSVVGLAFVIVSLTASLRSHGIPWREETH